MIGKLAIIGEQHDATSVDIQSPYRHPSLSFDRRQISKNCRAIFGVGAGAYFTFRLVIEQQLLRVLLIPVIGRFQQSAINTDPATRCHPITGSGYFPIY